MNVLQSGCGFVCDHLIHQTTIIAQAKTKLDEASRIVAAEANPWDQVTTRLFECIRVCSSVFECCCCAHKLYCAHKLTPTITTQETKRKAVEAEKLKNSDHGGLQNLLRVIDGCE